ISQPGDRTAEPSRYLVATDGNDAWSGRLPAPKADRSDGPIATPSRARDAIRALKRDAGGALPGPVRVAIRGGRYPLSEPLVLRPGDPGTERSRIPHTAYRGEEPVLSGGRAEGNVGGRPCRVAERLAVRGLDEAERSYHVATDGSDENPDSEAKPLRTIQ